MFSLTRLSNTSPAHPTVHLLELQFEVVHRVVPHEVRRHEELTTDLREPRRPLAELFDEALAVLRAEPTEVVATHDLEDTRLQHRRGLEDIVDSAKTTQTLQLRADVRALQNEVKVFKLRSFGVAGTIPVKHCRAGKLISCVANPAANMNRQFAAMPSRATPKHSWWLDMYGIE